MDCAAKYGGIGLGYFHLFFRDNAPLERLDAKRPFGRRAKPRLHEKSETRCGFGEVRGERAGSKAKAGPSTSTDACASVSAQDDTIL